MKKSLVCTNVALLLASTSAVTLAAPISVPNTFTAGTPARAAEVNANFTAVVNGVNANDTKITTNTNKITSNTDRITTNETNITKNTADIATLQSAVGAGCPSDMTAVGSLCVDKYEANVTDQAGTTEYGIGGTADYPCLPDGSDCGAGSTAGTGTPIYARSVVNVAPSRLITLYQAAQACANVGKRLPTTTEWQMAAAGTPPGNGGGCQFGTQGLTGSAATCVSNVGAFDMVGNVWEWASELDYTTGSVTTTDQLKARALGESAANVTGTPSTKSLFLPTSNAVAQNPEIGFRCVK